MSDFDAAPTQWSSGRLRMVLRAFAAEPLGEDTAALIAAQAAAAVGSRGAVLCAVVGRRVVVLAAEGYSRRDQSVCGELGVGDLTLPLTYVATTGEPVWLASHAETLQRFPRLVTLTPRPERAYAVLPLRVSGVVVGVLGVAFEEPHAFPEEERHFLAALADICAVHLHQRQKLLSQDRRPTSVAELGRLVLALSRAHTPPQVAQVIAEEGATAAAAAFANIALLSPDRTSASLVHAPTLIEEVARRYPAIPVDESTSLGTALGAGREVWLRSLTDLGAQYPGLLDDTIAAGLSATVSLPLRDGKAQVIGALGLGWSSPQPFDEQQRDEIRVLAQLAADALTRSRRSDRLERLTVSLDASARRLRALQAVTAALAAADTVEDVARVVVREGIALVADEGVAGLVDQERRVLRTWASAGFPEQTHRDYAVLGLDAQLPIVEAVRTDAPVVAQSQAEAAALSPASSLTYTATGTHSLLAVPAHSGGSVVGALAVGFQRPGAIDDEVVAFTSTLADLAGQAFQRAARHDRDARTAEILQRSLLPSLPAVTGVELAAAYSPSGHGAQVGGDWYEVIDRADGSTYLLIGDVMGHDIRAAAVMGQLRTAAHCYADLGHGPAHVLHQLHHLVDQLRDIDLVTCLCAIYDHTRHDARTLTVASAGHLPPMTMPAGDRATLLPVPADPPLGAGPSTYRQHTHHLTPDTQLALFTDGLVEVRGSGIDEGIDRLAAFLDAGRDHPLDVLAQLTVRHMAGHTRGEDDAALLLLRPLPRGSATDTQRT